MHLFEIINLGSGIEMLMSALIFFSGNNGSIKISLKNPHLHMQKKTEIFKLDITMLLFLITKS